MEVFSDWGGLHQLGLPAVFANSQQSSYGHISILVCVLLVVLMVIGGCIGTSKLFAERRRIHGSINELELDSFNGNVHTAE